MTISPCNILIIDDEDAILKLMLKALSGKGHRIDTAGSGYEGIKKVMAGSYDIVITDLKMPGLSGDQVTSRIKELKEDAIPVIGMSGTPWQMDRSLYDAVLAKPYTRLELFAAIEKVTSSS